MEDLGCPRCRTTKYSKPSLLLLINVCGHALCEACVDQLFVRESGTCPECNSPLRKSGFRTQLFEDTAVDKEVDIRKQIVKIFNKQESDFNSLREYNDYLEEVELVIENILMGRNVDSTRAKIARYKLDNESLIKKNQIRLNRERALYMDQVEKEKKQNELKRKIRDNIEKEESELKRKKQQTLLDNLEMNRHLSAQQVLSIHKQTIDKDSRVMSFDERITTMTQHEVAGILSIDSHSDMRKPDVMLPDTSCHQPYAYKYMKQDFLGPPMPSREDVLNAGYLNNVRQATERDVGGGYNSLTACCRALQDAYTGLLWRPCSTVDVID